MEYVRVAEVSVSVGSDRSGHASYTQLEGNSTGRGSFGFTRELITFFLYGKIPPKSSKLVPAISTCIRCSIQSLHELPVAI